MYFKQAVHVSITQDTLKQCWFYVGLMLGQRHRQCASIESTRPVFSVCAWAPPYDPNPPKCGLTTLPCLDVDVWFI